MKQLFIYVSDLQMLFVYPNLEQNKFHMKKRKSFKNTNAVNMNLIDLTSISSQHLL